MEAASLQLSRSADAVRLGDISEVFAGIGVSREDTVERPGSKLPVIGVRDLQDGAVTAREALDTVGFPDAARAVTYAVRVDDVLVTGRGTLLKFGLVSNETAGAIASGNVIVVRPGSAAAGGALFAILSSEVFRPKIEVLRRGATTLLSLSPKDLAKLEINLPSLGEQRRIAALVSDAQTAYRTAIEAAEIRRALARRLVDARLSAQISKLEGNMAKLTRADLENHLWKSADILRGSIDSSDYKIYIFGFLFLKRLSDRFEEEAQECIRKGLSKDIAYNDPDEHEFFLVERARWSELKKLTTGIGDQLNKACAAVEDANPSIEGVLANIDFNSESRLGDAKNREGVLARLIDHFSRIDLSNASLSEPDMLGRAYEYLIDKFADDAGKKGGEFYTPHPVVRLIVELLDPKPGMRISDPTCGSGGMLIESARHIADIEGKRLGQPVNVTLHGQEKNLGTWAIAKMNLLLHGLRDARIEKGDTIRNPRLLDPDGNLILYDRVIANPPFSLDAWGADDVSGENEKKSFNRFIYGIPPKNMGDLAFVQHMVATLNATGVCGVVMPHGVLFRGSGDGRIREGMLKADLFEAIVGLPENLFAGTGIPATVLILNKDKPKSRKGKVLFIHGAKEFEERPKKNILGEGNITRLVEAFRAWQDEDRFCRVVDRKEIEDNDFNLNISRYIDTLEPEKPIDVKAEFDKLWAAEKARDEAAARMNALLKEMGYVGQ